MKYWDLIRHISYLKVKKTNAGKHKLFIFFIKTY